MGKVLKAVAVIAVAAGIAVAAPWLAGFIAQAGTIAFTAASAAIAIGLGVAASAILKAISGPPSATRAFHPGSVLTPIGAPVTASRSVGGWRDPVFLPWQRFAIEPTTGTCMRPICKGSWIVVDRQAAVRSGDYVVIRVGDQRRYYWGGGRWRFPKYLFWGAVRSPMCKRFVGTNGSILMFECTNPPTRFETEASGVDILCRVRAEASSYSEARRIRRAIIADPSSYGERLATQR